MEEKHRNSHGGLLGAVKTRSLSLSAERILEAMPTASCFFVYFNQQGEISAKEYFDNERKVSRGIFEREKYK